MKNFVKESIITMALILLYIIKVYTVEMYELRIIDMILLVLIIVFEGLLVYKIIKNKTTKSNVILTCIMYIGICTIVISTFSNPTASSRYNLPWKVFNEFDKGKNSVALNNNTVEKNSCKDYPTQYLNDAIIDGDNYYIDYTVVACAGTSVSYIGDQPIVIDNDSISSMEDSELKLQYSDISVEKVIAATSLDNKIYSIIRSNNSGEIKQEITLHNNNGEYVKSKQFADGKFNEIFFATFSNNGKVYISQRNKENESVEIIEFDKDLNAKVVYTGETRIKSFAVFDDYILLVGRNFHENNDNDVCFGNGELNSYCFIKIDFDGNVIEKEYYIEPRSLYYSTIENVDLNRDGKIYFIRYLNTKNTIYNTWWSPKEEVASYIGMDIYGDNLTYIDTVYHYTQDSRDYRDFFQVKSIGAGYELYSHNGQTTLVLINKNFIGAGILVITSLVALFLTCLLSSNLVIKVVRKYLKFVENKKSRQSIS